MDRLTKFTSPKKNQLPFQALELLSDPEDDVKLIRRMIMFLRGEPSPPKPNKVIKKLDMGKFKTKDVGSGALDEGYRSAYITEKDTVQADHIIETPLEEEYSEQGELIYPKNHPLFISGYASQITHSSGEPPRSRKGQK
ncbi:hypothetical protein Fmac_016410 [Flemingia macrophylla]|uniref:Uncharacterized protein n=1 Tax=Flemingia macrophylla TaxID=520843 RepID=A0ABD1MHE7_9FABA